MSLRHNGKIMNSAYLSIITVLPAGNLGGRRDSEGAIKAQRDHFQCTVMVSIDPDSLITAGNTGLKLIKCFDTIYFGKIGSFKYSCFFIAVANDNTYSKLIVFQYYPRKVMRLPIFSHLSALLSSQKLAEECCLNGTYCTTKTQHICMHIYTCMHYTNVSCAQAYHMI